jgi:hypothetical protein
MPSFRATLLSLLIPANLAAADDSWRTVELLRDGGLVIRLKVKANASLADAEWLALEFENAGQRPLRFSEAGYAIYPEPHAPKLHRRPLSGGNSSQLFPGPKLDSWPGPIDLQPGQVRRVADQPSQFTAAGLGAAPADGRRVRATVAVWVFIGGRRLSTHENPVPFEFDWVRPPGGQTALAERLRALVASPQRFWVHGDLLKVMLDDPALAGTVSRDELYAGVARRLGRRAYGADAVARAMVRWFPDDSRLQTLCRERLVARDPDAVLLIGAGVWHSTFSELLVRLLVADAEQLRRALYWLRQLRVGSDSEASAANGLSTAVRQAAPALGKPAGRVADGDLSQWSQTVELVGQTGDRDMIEFLRPALDDRRKIRSDETLTKSANVPPIPRVCDRAADAILTLLDGNANAAWAAAAKSIDRDTWERIERSARDAREELSRAPSRATAVKAARAEEARYEAAWDYIITALEARLAKREE